jgi:hypothetical protein
MHWGGSSRRGYRLERLAYEGLIHQRDEQRRDQGIFCCGLPIDGQFEIQSKVNDLLRGSKRFHQGRKSRLCMGHMEDPMLGCRLLAWDVLF